VGIIRTYAYLGQNFTADGWVNALKRGQTFLSSGPVVEFLVNGERPGGKVRLPAAGMVTVEGKVWSSTPIRLVRIYHDGKPWKDVAVPPNATDLAFREQAKADKSGWFSLVVEADELPPAAKTFFSQAVTNAVRVYVGDGKIRSRESAEYFLTWIERLHNEISDVTLWRSEGERARAFRDLEEAANVYRARAQEARQ